jgi:Tfp pilus assembly protein PilX
MSKSRRNNQDVNVGQRGAALVTVILVSLLLGTACIAMLTAVGASSRNNTDALSEAKAFYAAESGLQATINYLRNTPSMTYSTALNQQGAGTFPVTGPVTINSETSYTIQISDPDLSAGSIVYETAGTFEQATAGTYASTRVFGTGADTLTISYVPQATTDVVPGVITSFGKFQIVKTGSGPTTLPSALRFRIDYMMSDPREGVRTIRGTIQTDGSVQFLTDTPGTQPTFSLMGSTVTLCQSSTFCTSRPILSVPPATLTPQTSETVYGRMTALEPFRLKVVATGMGPGSSRKQHEAIVQKNFFNDGGSSSAISMVGPNALFTVGASSQMTIDGGTVPSVTVSDTTGLQTVLSNHTNGTIEPPPEVAGNDLPDWQQSTTALDALVRQLRQTAQNSGRYFNGTQPTSFGNFAQGTGITFCEGSCTLGGNSEGGGILVVTGTFTTSGNPKFKGLVLAVGRYVSSTNPGGVVRSGGGNEVFIGNIVIAPYDPNNLAAGFEQPRYNQSGGPGDTINSDVDVDVAFNGTSAITNFMLGVAEK